MKIVKLLNLIESMELLKACLLSGHETQLYKLEEKLGGKNTFIFYCNRSSHNFYRQNKK